MANGDPGYELKKIIETATTVLTVLGDHWGELPAPVAQQINELRATLAADLPGAQPFMRATKINTFLQALAALPDLTPLIGSTLDGAKARPGMRSGLSMVSDAEVQEILPLLKPMQASGVYTADFYSYVRVPAKVGADGVFPVIAQLTATPPPIGAEKVGKPFTISFPDNKTAVTVEVFLNASGLSEETDTWSRTVTVFPNRDSDLAVFALRPKAKSSGEQRLAITYGQPLTIDGYRTEIEEREGFSATHSTTLTPDPKAAVTRRGAGSTSAVSFHTNVTFPGQVKPKSVTPLVVQLTLKAPDETSMSAQVKVEFDDPTQPTQLDVVVTGDDFTEITGSHARTMTVYSFADSQPVIFMLEAGDALGKKAITVDFYHKGSQIGSGEFVTEITQQPASERRELSVNRAMATFDGFGTRRTLPADVLLRITKSKESGSFQFMLHSSRPEVNRHFDPMGSMPLQGTADPQEYLATQFHELSQWAAISKWQPDNADHQRVVRELEVMGERLFQDLFSPELKEAYWELMDLREQGMIKSLLITSDEPWIPWELVKPFDQRKNKSDDFLAGGWQLSRWLSGPSLGDELKVESVRAVIPQLGLPFTQRESSYIEGLGLKGMKIGAFLRTKQELTDAAGAGKIQLIHVAAHGNFKSERPDESPIILQDGDELFPRDMAGSWLSSLRTERPILFLNACHSAQVGFSLTGLGGWAQTAVQNMRVSAFIGGLWEVNDELASEMAVQFYENLRRGLPLGEAFQTARTFIRQKNPGNSTWLAYSLYGDPNMRVTWAV